MNLVSFEFNERKLSLGLRLSKVYKKASLKKLKTAYKICEGEALLVCSFPNGVVLPRLFQLNSGESP